MKTLIYCGTNHGEGLKRYLDMEHWDRVYGFEANPHLYSKLKQQYINDIRVKMYNVILSNQHNIETEFYILDPNNAQMDYASSVCKLEDFHPNYKKLTGNQIALREVVRLKTLNLYTFLQQEGIVESSRFVFAKKSRVGIDFVVTDLESSDLTVLKTLKPLIDTKKIKKIKCETEPDHLPTLCKGLDNKLKGFKELLDKNYTHCDSSEVPAHYYKMDHKWKIKK